MDEYKIYCLTFPNGKKYVGQTKQKCSERWCSHSYINNKEMSEAIEMFGWANISKEVLEIVNTREEAIDREAYYISLYHATDSEYGYNKAIRDNNRKYDISEIKKKWEEGKSVKEIAEEIGAKVRSVGLALKEIGVSNTEKFSRGHNAYKKSVGQYDLKGNLIKTYPSAREAERETGYPQSNIWRCCKEKHRICHGYKWRYIENEEQVNELGTSQET